MIHFVGAGSGAPDLITVRGQKFLQEADVIIYAGSLVNPELLNEKKEGCKVYNSATMTLEEVLDVMFEAEEDGLMTVRLHTGDPCLYGAIREQMDVLDEKGIAYDYCPGVSSFCGAASALNLEYTLAGRFPERHHHPHGRKNPGAGKRGDRLSGFSPCDDGGIFEYRYAGKTLRALDRRRVYNRHAGGYCIQGYLGG